MNYKFTCFSDPGHGWLEVPVSILETLGIENKISICSYKNGRMSYLEEDNDMPLFLNSFVNEYGKDSFTILERNTDSPSPIRKYQTYKGN